MLTRQSRPLLRLASLLGPRIPLRVGRNVLCAGRDRLFVYSFTSRHVSTCEPISSASENSHADEGPSFEGPLFQNETTEFEESGKPLSARADVEQANETVAEDVDVPGQFPTETHTAGQFDTANRAEVIQSKEIDVAMSPRTSGSAAGFQMPERLVAEGDVHSALAPWCYTLYRGPNGQRVRIHYSADFDESEAIAKKFLHEKVLGLDLEYSHPGSTVAVIQLAKETDIAIFHVCLYNDARKQIRIPPTVLEILASRTIVKAGMANDAISIRNSGAACNNLVELSHLHCVLMNHIPGERNTTKFDGHHFALSTLVSTHLGRPMDKKPPASGSWAQNLTSNNRALQYAANDVYAAYWVYRSMDEKRQKLDPVPDLPSPLDFDGHHERESVSPRQEQKVDLMDDAWLSQLCKLEQKVAQAIMSLSTVNIALAHPQKQHEIRGSLAQTMMDFAEANKALVELRNTSTRRTPHRTVPAPAPSILDHHGAATSPGVSLPTLKSAAPNSSILDHKDSIFPLKDLGTWPPKTKDLFLELVQVRKDLGTVVNPTKRPKKLVPSDVLRDLALHEPQTTAHLSKVKGAASFVVDAKEKLGVDILAILRGKDKNSSNSAKLLPRGATTRRGVRHLNLDRDKNDPSSVTVKQSIADFVP